MYYLNKLKAHLLALFSFKVYATAPAEFGSRGGTNDEAVGVAFKKGLYLEKMLKTIVGSLSKPNKRVAGKTSFAPTTLDNSSFIWVTDIQKGDEKRIKLEEIKEGMGVHGNIAVRAGDFAAYLDQAYRINTVKSPGFQVFGEEEQKRIAHSIMNCPQAVKDGAINWLAQEDNYDFIISLLWGADKSLLKTRANGGLGVSLGPGSGIGEGTPLCGMHWYTTDTGFATYDASALSAWNTIVNDAVNGIDAAAADKLTLAQMDKIREKLDDLHFMPGTLNGKEYKAVCLMDPQMCYRLANILKTDYTSARSRGKDNPIFNVNYQTEHSDILYLSVPDLKKFRPDYNAATGYIDIGPGITQDPRSYTTSSTNGLAIYLGAGAVLMGKDGMVNVTRAEADHGPEDGLAISVRQRRSFKRNQWDSKDGRTASKCYSVLTASFYEPGIDWS